MEFQSPRGMIFNAGLVSPIQSNLGDSNADFSKPPDFSNLTVSPDLFCYYFM